VRAVAGALAIVGASMTLPAQAEEGTALLGPNALSGPRWEIFAPSLSRPVERASSSMRTTFDPCAVGVPVTAHRTEALLSMISPEAGGRVDVAVSVPHSHAARSHPEQRFAKRTASKDGYPSVCISAEAAKPQPLRLAECKFYGYFGCKRSTLC
jgi:hypothetical protein